MTSLARPPDEFANCLTHGLGFLLSLAGAAHLITRVAGQPTAIIIACELYSVALLSVYASSTLSHLFYDLTWRQRCRTWDQASIFLLIAGTYTPLSLLYLNRGAWQWLLIMMWTLAVSGVYAVAQVRELSRYAKLSYGFLGCLPVIALNEASRRAPFEVLVWIVIGGAAYIFGVPFLCRSASVRYAHAMWHLFVMVGSACHYRAILLAVEGYGGVADG